MPQDQKPIHGPRKRRTRQHVIADVGVHHVQGRILEAGYTSQRVDSDYGYDLIAFTYDDGGYVEPGCAFIQVKAAESLTEIGPIYILDVLARDYNLWMFERLPVILILFDASRRKAYWLPFQKHFRANPGRTPRASAKTVRIRVPKRTFLVHAPLQRCDN